MTDRIQDLTVVLDSDIREDDVECIMDAILMIKGVQSVGKGKPVNFEDHMARQRVYMDVREKLFDVLTLEGPKPNGSA